VVSLSAMKRRGRVERRTDKRKRACGDEWSSSSSVVDSVVTPRPVVGIAGADDAAAVEVVMP
jgi:hypothetical protein